MTGDEQFPTSFRLTAEELGQLDELAGLIYRRMGGRVTVSRKAALMVAIDLALAEEHARAQLALSDPEPGTLASTRAMQTADSPREWRCRLCDRDIAWSHVKRHLNTTHRGDKPGADREWLTFLDSTGWPTR